MQGADGRHIEFRCRTCGAPACFGFGCNLLKTPPKLGDWYCREHRQAGQDAAAAAAAALEPGRPEPPVGPPRVPPAPPAQPAGTTPSQVRPAMPTQGRLI